MTVRRRKYLVNTSYQIRTILIFAGISFIGCVIAAATFYFFTLNSLESLRWSTHISAESTGELIKPLFLKINLAGFLFISVILAIVALLFLRKTSGQLSQISEAIDRAADGDLSTESFSAKQNDFRDVMHDIEEMVRGVRERYQAVHDQYRAVSARLSDLPSKTNDRDHEALLNEITVLEEKLGEFKVID